jgi:hypothetical protein
VHAGLSLRRLPTRLLLDGEAGRDETGTAPPVSPPTATLAFLPPDQEPRGTPKPSPRCPAAASVWSPTTARPARPTALSRRPGAGPGGRPTATATGSRPARAPARIEDQHPEAWLTWAVTSPKRVSSATTWSSAAIPPDSAGNGCTDPAETPPRTVLSSGCSQIRCDRQRQPAISIGSSVGGRRLAVAVEHRPAAPAAQQHQVALVSPGRPERMRPGVAERMRMQVPDAGVGAAALEHRVHAVCRQGRPAPATQPEPRRVCIWMPPPLAEVAIQRPGGLDSEWDRSVAGAAAPARLARYVHDSVAQIDVGDLEDGELRQPEPPSRNTMMIAVSRREVKSVRRR